MTDDLVARLTAVLDETVNAAQAALAGYPSTMGGGYEGCEPSIMSSVWQAAYHEVFQVMTEEPSAAFIARHVPGASVERMKRRKVADCGPANVYPAQHIARHDPASVLRGCAADRKVLERHATKIQRCGGHSDSPHQADCFDCAYCDTRYWPCPDLKDLAERYGLEIQDTP